MLRRDADPDEQLLRRLRLARKGRHLKLGEAERCTHERGTVRYPEAA